MIRDLFQDSLKVHRMGIERAWGQKVKFYKRMAVWYGSRESQGLELWSGVGNKKSPCPGLLIPYLLGALFTQLRVSVDTPMLMVISTGLHTL